MIERALIQDYNKTRVTKDTSLICHAPFTNINFEQNGNATACCYNRTHMLGTYPNDTLMDMWFGESADELRQYIKDNNLDGGCSLCKKQLYSRNFNGMRAKGYDWGADRPVVAAAKKAAVLLTKGKYIQMPTSMEFELSNVCNLECVMCNGYFSSSIRKNREKAEPLTNPYDEAFVEQLVPFLSYMRDARFLGGEPFLIDIYYNIWEKIAEHNPSMRVHITTNATVLNNKAKGLLERMNSHIILSMDSIVKDTYEQIRKNAKFDRVWEHLQYFLEYTRRKKTQISMAVCPITLNWHEMPDLVRYCNQEGIKVFFNTVYRPEGYTLELLPTDKLEEIVNQLDDEATHLPENDYLTQYNKNMYLDMVNQIRAWRENSKDDESIYIDDNGGYTSKLVEEALDQLSSHEMVAGCEHPELTKEILKNLLFTDFLDQNDQTPEPSKEVFSNDLYKALHYKMIDTGAETFMRALMDAYRAFAVHTGRTEPELLNDLTTKMRQVEELTLSHTEQKAIVKEMIRTKPRHFIDMSLSMSVDDAREAFLLHYGAGQ